MGGGGGAYSSGQHWAIPLFNYTPLQMTINGVHGGIGNMSRGVGGLKGILVQGKWNNIQTCPGMLLYIVLGGREGGGYVCNYFSSVGVYG